MLLKRLQRFEKDDRIAVVESIDRIPSCGRIFSRVNGVLCPYHPFTAAEEAEVVSFMSSLMSKVGVQEVIEDPPDDYHSKIYGLKLPPQITRAFAELQQIFKRSTGLDGRAMIRANSLHPRKPHQHEPTLTYTFAGAGTIGYKMNGESYTVPNKHIFIFDKEIPHMATQEFPKDHPKLTIIVT